MFSFEAKQIRCDGSHQLLKEKTRTIPGLSYLIPTDSCAPINVGWALAHRIKTRDIYEDGASYDSIIIKHNSSKNASPMGQSYTDNSPLRGLNR